MPVLTSPALPPSAYYMSYPEGVTAFALSANRSFGLYNVGLEVGLRHNASLASTNGADVSAFAPVPATNNSDNPGYATGKTAHANLSLLATLDESPLWREATLTGEIAWNRMLSVTKNVAALDPNGTRDGVALSVQLEPTYRGLLPGLTLGVPVGLGWSPRGSRPLAAGGPGMFPSENGGHLSVGLNGSFRDAWRFTLNYTHYFGPRAPGTVDGHYTWQQTLADRDFVSASLRYSFWHEPSGDPSCCTSNLARLPGHTPSACWPAHWPPHWSPPCRRPKCPPTKPPR